jgi:cytochrome P450 family 6
MTLWRSFELPAFFMLPQVMKFFRLKTFTTFATKFINSTIPTVMTEREKQGIKRHDLIDTLLELKKSHTELTDDMLIAQAASFFSDGKSHSLLLLHNFTNFFYLGFETSSATQSFALFEIAKNNNIQEKLRSEIGAMLMRTEGKVTYDAVMNIKEMPYLHQVVLETLRLYPVLSVLDRKCVNPDGYSLKPFSDFTITCGMPIYIPVYAMQRDKKYFPDPLKFDPERFSPENVGSLHPFVNFPFGAGPRSCIGQKFGLLQVKTGIIQILKDFRLEPTDDTPKEIVLQKKALIIQSEKKLFLNLVKDPVCQL